MNILETDRLILRQLTLADADFILSLVNEPAWLRFIGDKGVRTLAGARDYITQGPMASYERLGFGLWLMVLKADDIPIGMCGLIKRDTLPEVDLGFALSSPFVEHGYVREAAAAVLAHGQSVFGLQRILAITKPDNERSIKVLETVGFRFERMIRLSEGAPELKLFAHE